MAVGCSSSSCTSSILLSFSLHHCNPSHQRLPLHNSRFHTSFRVPPLSTTQSFRRRLSTVKPKAGNNDAVEPPDRIISAVCYLYPFLDGVHYGKFVITQFPTFQLILSPFLPAIRLFNSFPLNGFLVFLTLYFAIVRNPQAFSRYVRFNTMQAVVLDILLIFPDLLERGFNPKDGLGLDLVMSFDSTIFLYLLVCMVYGSGSCLLGKVPRLPLVADAADRQVM